MRGSKAVLTLLEKQGVEVMFGYPGSYNLPIFDDLLQSSIHHVLVRHEQCAAHMADGYARSTGKPGVCMSTSGPGATNLVTGVATAYADSSPLIVMTGQVPAERLGDNAFQEADVFSLMMPITKHSFRVLSPDRLPAVMEDAYGIASSGRMGPVHIDLPVDVLKQEVPEPWPKYHGLLDRSSEDLSGVLDAVRLLSSAERPMILAGGGAIWSRCTDELLTLAEMLMAPVSTTLMGKGIIPEEHPLALGMMGMHGRGIARRAFEQCDVMLVVGARFSDRSTTVQSDLPESIKIIQIDIDPMEAGKDKRTKVRIVGDARKALQNIIKGLGRTRKDTPWGRRMKHLRQQCDCSMDLPGEPIKPQKVIYELSKVLADDAYVCTEVGQNQMWAAHFLRIKTPGHFITSGGMGTMGFGFPAALGVKYAHREKQVVDIAGDGSLMMNSRELATAVNEDLPVVICLMNNNWLGMVRQLQNVAYGRRYSGTDLARNPDFVMMAHAYGAEGVKVEKASELEEAFQRAFRSDVPFLIDIHVDPEEDMLPMVPGGKSSRDVIHGRCRWGCEMNGTVDVNRIQQLP
ncbi:MAG: acetolactate synthase catalytic subunit [Methanomassiliicoccales archaeon PtaU1.Bin124]|nr:MAG: acetolactate synthase catalytic subunit [Methanomassiliicoccales archaeon PtaU1.Bin124]